MTTSERNTMQFQHPSEIDPSVQRARVRAMKARIAASRIAYLESLAKPTKRDREQLATERAILASCS